ncbi:hypothetical protein [Taklimakanibacter deserti]|uniref:hypothetical protein n=1 Tax=Taklimakanibacter deserti TaxID=2267839 RepID=UPI000E64B1CC
MPDKRAKDILFNAYWKTGWKSDADRQLDPTEFAYAKSKRYMFDAISLTHDQAVNQLLSEKRLADKTNISNAFLASLGTRRLDARSALGSYGFAANFPSHTIASVPNRLVPSGARCCQYCGFYEFPSPEEIDLNVLNFERHKWGGVRRDDLAYAWLDLSLFREIEPQHPTDADKRVMRQILKVAASLPPTATASLLEKALAGLFASSKYERRVLIEILCICGILQPKNRSGYFGEFTLAFEREHTSQHYNDWRYPAMWWRGSDGINPTAVEAYFSDL